MVRKMRRPLAGVAQLVEQLICNQQVAGSTPVAGSSLSRQRHEKLTAGRNWRQSRAFLEPAQPGLEGNGEVPEWLNGADCKSAGSAYVGSNPALSTSFLRFCWFFVCSGLNGICCQALNRAGVVQW